MNHTIRAALFTDADVFAGTERHMFDLSIGLRAAGIEVSIACPSQSELDRRAAEAGIPIHVIEKGGIIDAAAILALARLLRRREIDLIHSHNGRTMLAAAAAIFLARRGRLIATQHFLEPDHLSHRGLKGLLYRAAHRWVNGRIDHFITVSNAAKICMIARHEAASAKVTVTPHGIPTEEEANHTPPGAIREQLGISPDAPLIVCVARLEPEKGIGSLLEAMSIVAPAHPQAVCVIAGDGSQQHEMEAKISALKLENNVRLLGYRQDARSLMGAADFVALPSLQESFGLVLLEAMASGKPVVATRCGGPEEIVLDGETGLLVPAANPRALAEALAHLLSDREWARAMGVRGRQRYREHFTVERMARQTLEVYRRALQGL